MPRPGQQESRSAEMVTMQMRDQDRIQGRWIDAGSPKWGKRG